jgi:hypothetical protein
MKRFSLFALVCLTAMGIFVASSAAEDESTHQGESAAPPPASLAPLSFGVGEELVFNVMYGFVKAGTATLAIPEMVDSEGRKAYHITSRARSSKGFSMVFEVNDKVDSYWDAAALRSVRFEKHLREGDYKKDEEIRFDYAAGKARYRNGKEVPIESDVQDMLSSLYRVRTLDLEVGRSIFMEAHSDGKNYNLEVRVIAEERVTTPAGTFDCYVVEPLLKGAGLFRHKGSLQIWFAKDGTRMPVLMKTKIPVGSIVAELASYRAGAPADAGTGAIGPTVKASIDPSPAASFR